MLRVESGMSRDLSLKREEEGDFVAEENSRQADYAIESIEVVAGEIFFEEAHSRSTFAKLDSEIPIGRLSVCSPHLRSLFPYGVQSLFESRCIWFC